MKATVHPYQLRDRVTSQLREKEAKGIIKQVSYSDWASKIVVVPKPNGQLRLCCNYRPTINPNLKDDVYPLPLIDDILSVLGGNKIFTTLDLQGAYCL